MSGRFKSASKAFRAQGGILRMSEAIDAGISRKTLYTMRDVGVVEQLSRGVYRLASLPALAQPELVTVATKIPNGVICLISALAFHELTTQIPRAVDIAVPPGTKKPRFEHPPVNLYRFSGTALTEGVRTPVVDRQSIRVYCAEKSVADAFKYRNKIGLDVALEALRTWRSRRGASLQTLLRYARVCRVERVMRPYIESVA